MFGFHFVLGFGFHGLDAVSQVKWLLILEVQHLSRRECVLFFQSQLRKVYQTPAFPPKRVRNTNPRVLEERRQGLETYLQVGAS
jgi:hypothetical protein